jgi:hypothetical protein
MLVRADSSSSNWTGRPVFCCTTVARVRTRPPLTRSPIRILTTSQPRSLLSMAKSKRARSRSRPSRSNQKRIAHTCCGFSARLAPASRPAFQGRLSRVAGSNSECPIASSLWPEWPARMCDTKQPVAVTRTLLDDHGALMSRGLTDWVGWFPVGPLLGTCVRIAAVRSADPLCVSRAIWTGPREAERMRRVCGIRTH